MNLGSRVKEARISRGMKQGELAEAAGTSQAVISALEKRDSKTSEQIFELADALRVNPRWLQTGHGESGLKANSWAPRSAQLPDEAHDIAVAWMRLTPARQQAIREWVFLESVLAQHYPWLMPGRPSSQSYSDYERSVEEDIVRITKRMMMENGKEHD